MNVWLCPIKPNGWRIIKNLKVFGFPKRVSEVVSKVRLHDLIAFHILTPVNGIVAICEVASEVYENYSDIWGKNRYPLRVKIRFVPSLTKDENTAIPISLLFQKPKDGDEMTIEPYLKNVWITKVTQKQYKRLENAFQKRSTTRMQTCPESC